MNKLRYSALVHTNHCRDALGASARRMADAPRASLQGVICVLVTVQICKNSEHTHCDVLPGRWCHASSVFAYPQKFASLRIFCFAAWDAKLFKKIRSSPLVFLGRSPSAARCHASDYRAALKKVPCAAQFSFQYFSHFLRLY